MFFGSRFTAPPPRTKQAALDEPTEAVFTPDEAFQLQRLRHQFLRCPASFTLDMNYRRIDFYRWLAERGDISEGIEGGVQG